MAERSDLDILADLEVDPIRKEARAHTPREARIIAGFEDIQRFVKEYDRLPQHGPDRDIFERLYAVRLDRLRDQSECLELLRDLDTEGILSTGDADGAPEELDDDALLTELGVSAAVESEITELKYVRTPAERRAAEEIAAREPCPDFEKFRPLFDEVQTDIESGRRKTRPFGKDAEVNRDEFFILRGQKAYVAEMGSEFLTEENRPNRRLRVIFDNGTQAHFLLRSFQRALYKEENGQRGRRITAPDAGPLFEGEAAAEGRESGTIYVLRSRSDHPMIRENREVIHKIGVTGGDVEKRIAIAERDPTYLLAPVDIIASYKLVDINRTGLENLLHRFFARARLDITIKDRFGNPVKPREWFLAPLPVINEAVERLQKGTLAEVRYDPETASLVEG